MAVPKKKISQSRSKRRHSAWQRAAMGKLAKLTTLGKCAECGEKKLSHHVCEACGQYRGKQILTVKSGSGPQIVDAA